LTSACMERAHMSGDNSHSFAGFPLTFPTSTSTRPGNSEPAASTTSDRGRETFGLAPRTADLALVARGLQCAGGSVIFAETLGMTVGKTQPASAGNSQSLQVSAVRTAIAGFAEKVVQTGRSYGAGGVKVSE
jgi:hypothetical protein